MSEKLHTIWPVLAQDGVGDAIGDARPTFVVSLDGRFLHFANAAGARFLALAPARALDARVALEPRLADRLARFAAAARPGDTGRELIRFFDGLRSSLLSVGFRRLAGDAVLVTVDNARTDPADAAPAASLAAIAAEGGLVALFDAEGEVVVALGDHAALDGVQEEIEAALDADDGAPVFEQRFRSATHGHDVALVRLGDTDHPRRLLRVGPPVPLPAEVPEAVPAPAPAAEAEAPDTIEPAETPAPDTIEPAAETTAATDAVMPLDAVPAEAAPAGLAALDGPEIPEAEIPPKLVDPEDATAALAAAIAAVTRSASAPDAESDPEIETPDDTAPPREAAPIAAVTAAAAAAAAGLAAITLPAGPSAIPAPPAEPTAAVESTDTGTVEIAEPIEAVSDSAAVADDVLAVLEPVETGATAPSGPDTAVEPTVPAPESAPRVTDAEAVEIAEPIDTGTPAPALETASADTPFDVLAETVTGATTAVPLAAPAPPSEEAVEAAAESGISGPLATALVAAPAALGASAPIVVAAEEPSALPAVEATTAGSEPAADTSDTATAPAEAPVEPPGATAREAVSEPAGFRHRPLGRPVKFVWQMDAERRFTLVSDEFATAVGPRAAAIIGRSWSEVAADFGLDTEGRVAAALERRDTWSGRTVSWPVEGEALRVPVDLAALPAFDRGRIFAGYRGFGTVRADEPIPDPTAIGLRLAAPAPTAPDEVADAHGFGEAAEAPPAYPDDTEVALVEAAHPQPVEATIDGGEAAFAGEIEPPPAGDASDRPAEPETLSDDWDDAELALAMASLPACGEGGFADADDTVAATVAAPLVMPIADETTEPPADIADTPPEATDAPPAPTDTVAEAPPLPAMIALASPLALTAEARRAAAVLFDEDGHTTGGVPAAPMPAAAIVPEAVEMSPPADLASETEAPDAPADEAEPRPAESEVIPPSAIAETIRTDGPAEADEPAAGTPSPDEPSAAESAAPVAVPTSWRDDGATLRTIAIEPLDSEPEDSTPFEVSTDGPEAPLKAAFDATAGLEISELSASLPTLTPLAAVEPVSGPATLRPVVSDAAPAAPSLDETADSEPVAEAPRALRASPPTEADADRIATLVTATRPPAEAVRLSPPERVAFRQIAEALGARIEGEDRPGTEAPPRSVATTAPNPVTVPPAAPAGTLAAERGEEAIARDTRLLDRLPSAVAVVKDDSLVYGNDAFLRLLGYPDLATLDAEGGLDALFAGEHVARRWKVGPDGSRPVPVLTRDGTVVPVDAQVATVPWGSGSALMLTMTAVEAPEKATPGEALSLGELPPPAALVAPSAPVEIAPVEAAAVPAAPLVETPTAVGLAAGLADTELRERVGELEAIIDTATDGVLLLDGEGVILSANHAAEALFGTDRADMVGRPLADRLAPESRRSAMDYLDGLARNGVASVLNDGREVIGVVERGGLIPLFMTIGRISAAPARKYCAVLRDITHWKKSEEDLTAARRRAEEASVHKSDFLAKISHEIRTPLNAIIGFSEVMMDERFGPIGNERYKDYLRDIHSSGSHIMSLINDLLDLSKVEAGKMDLRFEAVVLADIMSECVAMMQPQANRERIIIRSSLPAGVPAVVADPRSVRQVMLNLLSNAIKFTPSGGQVIVSTTLEDSGEVVMRVRDTGYGMTEKELQTAMEPFRQLHTTRSRGGGTGLGLPLTKALVEANRAVLRIDSTVGQGTLVTVTFPVTRVLAG